jgi:hypothetical protein
MFNAATQFNQDLSFWDGEFSTDAAGWFCLASLAAMTVSYCPA